MSAGVRFEHIFRQFAQGSHLSLNLRQSAPTLSSTVPQSEPNYAQPPPAMFRVKCRRKSDILETVQDFVTLHRKPVHLFSKIKCRILNNLGAWTATELGVVCHAWAQLGFLKEDFCVAISDRVADTAETCTVDSLVHLMDAFATTRCVVASVVDAINAQVKRKVYELDPRQLGLYCSSLARLNVCDVPLLTSLRVRILVASEKHDFSARDITLSAYSFAKLGCTDSILFGRLASLTEKVMRDFTAKDLQMMATAFEREPDDYTLLYSILSIQAQRRIAQFSPDAIVLLMKAFAKKGMNDSALATRVIGQLPRIALGLQGKEAACLLNSMSVMGMKSEVAMNVLGGVVRENVRELGVMEWLSVLKSMNAMNARNEELLTCFSSSIDQVVKKATANQVAQVADVLAKLEYKNVHVLDVLTESLSKSIDDISPGSAADIYCSYASLGAYENPNHTRLMQSVMQKALQREQVCFN